MISVLYIFLVNPRSMICKFAFRFVKVFISNLSIQLCMDRYFMKYDYIYLGPDDLFALNVTLLD